MLVLCWVGLLALLVVDICIRYQRARGGLVAISSCKKAAVMLMISASTVVGGVQDRGEQLYFTLTPSLAHCVHCD